MPQIFSETKQKYIKKNIKCVVNIVREFEAFETQPKSIIRRQAVYLHL